MFYNLILKVAAVTGKLDVSASKQLFTSCFLFPGTYVTLKTRRNILPSHELLDTAFCHRSAFTS